jgi:epoxyqueuosine reductase
LDARRCLSWWTIEHRGPLDASLWPYVKECLFGCDRCQTVCPHNARVLAGEPALAPTSDTDLEMIAAMDQATYERLFGGTTLTRAKREGLRRNARAALNTRK